MTPYPPGDHRKSQTESPIELVRRFCAAWSDNMAAAKLPGKSFELPVMGTFEVSGGKINAWRDCFDLNQFTSRMG